MTVSIIFPSVESVTNGAIRADSNRIYSRRDDRRTNFIGPVYYRGDQGH